MVIFNKKKLVNLEESNWSLQKISRTNSLWRPMDLVSRTSIVKDTPVQDTTVVMSSLIKLKISAGPEPSKFMELIQMNGTQMYRPILDLQPIWPFTQLLCNQAIGWWVLIWLKEVIWLMDSSPQRRRSQPLPYSSKASNIMLILILESLIMMLLKQLPLNSSQRSLSLVSLLIQEILITRDSEKFAIRLVHISMLIWHIKVDLLQERQEITLSNMLMLLPLLPIKLWEVQDQAWFSARKLSPKPSISEFSQCSKVVLTINKLLH